MHTKPAGANGIRVCPPAPFGRRFQWPKCQGGRGSGYPLLCPSSLGRRGIPLLSLTRHKYKPIFDTRLNANRVRTRGWSGMGTQPGAPLKGRRARAHKSETPGAAQDDIRRI